MQRNCLVCCNSFVGKRKTARMCSNACQKRFNYLQNKQHLDAYRAEWGKNNRDKQSAYLNKTRAANPEKYRPMRRVSENIRRARKNQGGGSYTEQEWQELLQTTGFMCLCCKRTDVMLTVDHVIPVSIGGSSRIDNIQPLCKPCNSRKHNRHIDYRGLEKAA